MEKLRLRRLPVITEQADGGIISPRATSAIPRQRYAGRVRQERFGPSLKGGRRCTRDKSCEDFETKPRRYLIARRERLRREGIFAILENDYPTRIADDRAAKALRPSKLHYC